MIRLLLALLPWCSVLETMTYPFIRMTNIRPLLFLLLAVSILGAVACGTNEPAVTPTITVQVVPQIFPSTSTPSVPTPTAIPTAVSTPTAIPILIPTPTILPIPSSGAFDRKWGTQGSGDGQFSLPRGVALGSDGSIYVTDGDNNRIQKFTPEGVFVSKWGTWGTSDGEFNEPIGIAVASDGSVYVADTSNHRIQKFAPGS